VDRITRELDPAQNMCFARFFFRVRKYRGCEHSIQKSAITNIIWSSVIPRPMKAIMDTSRWQHLIYTLEKSKLHGMENEWFGVVNEMKQRTQTCDFLTCLNKEPMCTLSSDCNSVERKTINHNLWSAHCGVLKLHNFFPFCQRNKELKLMIFSLV